MLMTVHSVCVRVCVQYTKVGSMCQCRLVYVIVHVDSAQLQIDPYCLVPNTVKHSCEGKQDSI